MTAAAGRAPARLFRDRRDAGRALAARLTELAVEEPVVIGLARGGVPVAAEVARALGAALDVLVVRKIGAPGNPEYGVGAVAEGGVLVLHDDAVRGQRMSHEELEAAIARARLELAARVAHLRGDRRPIDLRGRTAIVVDDGLATGGTARAALRAVRARQPRRVVLAVPVGAPRAVAALREQADDIVCILQPERLRAVGAWYEDFTAIPDDEVVALLDGDDPDPASPPCRPREVRVPVACVTGDLALPEPCAGLVIFAHGSGSSRHSPRNRRVAAALNERGLATLLLDLLTEEEEVDRTNVFDIDLLSRRLVAATRWSLDQRELRDLPIGYFGASTGAAAALTAAADLGGHVAAVVSRGGRPDLAAPRLAEVLAPVLLIVGGNDDLVLELNREAQAMLLAPSEVAVVPGATHLFEEPGALDEVARLAGTWFGRHLAGAAVPA